MAIRLIIDWKLYKMLFFKGRRVLRRLVSGNISVVEITKNLE